MADIKEKRTENLGVMRLTKSEKLALEQAYRKENYFSLSDYLRHKLLDEEELSLKDLAVIKVADREIAAGKYIPELGEMGDKVNQIAKRMNTFKDGEISKDELLLLVETIRLLLKVKKTLIVE